jgi:hypothetical protein
VPREVVAISIPRQADVDIFLTHCAHEKIVNTN